MAPTTQLCPPDLASRARSASVPEDIQATRRLPWTTSIYCLQEERSKAKFQWWKNFPRLELITRQKCIQCCFIQMSCNICLWGAKGATENRSPYCPVTTSSNTDNAGTMAYALSPSVMVMLENCGLPWACVCGKMADSTFLWVHYTSLWRNMNSSSTRSRRLASCVSGETHVRLHLPQSVAILW